MFKGRLKGLTGLEIGIVAVVMGITLAIAFSGFAAKREISRARACQEILFKIEVAVDRWAVANNKRDGDKVTWKDLVGESLYLKEIPRCPCDGKYPRPLIIGTTPTCDYTPPEWFDTMGHRYVHRMQCGCGEIP